MSRKISIFFNFFRWRQACRKDTEQRLKLLEEQLQKQRAEEVVEHYAEQIKGLPVSFDSLMTAKLIEKRRQELLKQLEITFNNPELTQALKTLSIVKAPKIEEAISAKTQQITLAAEQQHQVVQLLEEEKQKQKKRDEEQRLKLLEEQLQKQRAEEVVEHYAEQIKGLPVSFDSSMTAELIEKRRQELLEQLKNITLNKPELTQALKTLNIVKAPKIEEAISAKTQQITLAAEQQHQVVQLLEEQQLNLLKEEQLEKQLEETQQRQQFRITSLSLINDALGDLAHRISGVNQHHSSDAVNRARRLLEALNRARDDYNTALNQPNVTLSQASTAFKQTCRNLINDAKTQLADDLGWGDYLTNFFKKIANAVIWLGSFGQRSSFFPPVQPTSVIAIEQAEQRLEL